MASLSSTYASNSHSVASPFLFRAIFSPDSKPRFCNCNSSRLPIYRQRSFVGFPSQCHRRMYYYQSGSSDSNPSPTPPSDPSPSEGESISEALSRVQDTVQIFFAVFFWMALFFWASAWDGRNGGKRNKGTRFK